MRGSNTFGLSNGNGPYPQTKFDDLSLLFYKCFHDRAKAILSIFWKTSHTLFASKWCKACHFSIQVIRYFLCFLGHESFEQDIVS